MNLKGMFFDLSNSFGLWKFNLESEVRGKTIHNRRWLWGNCYSPICCPQIASSSNPILRDIITKKVLPC